MGPVTVTSRAYRYRLLIILGLALGLGSIAVQVWPAARPGMGAVLGTWDFDGDAFASLAETAAAKLPAADRQVFLAGIRRQAAGLAQVSYEFGPASMVRIEAGRRSATACTYAGHPGNILVVQPADPQVLRSVFTVQAEPDRIVLATEGFPLPLRRKP